MRNNKRSLKFSSGCNEFTELGGSRIHCALCCEISETFSHSNASNKQIGGHKMKLNKRFSNYKISYQPSSDLETIR